MTWKQYRRLACSTDIIEARVAEGGERYGINGLDIAKPGQMLCRNPSNDHRWAMLLKSFDELYCEVGKQRPDPKPKTQAAGYRKGQSKHSTTSHTPQGVEEAGLFELTGGEEPARLEAVEVEEEADGGQGEDDER